jgi:hypothetical protein
LPNAGIENAGGKAGVFMADNQMERFMCGSDRFVEFFLVRRDRGRIISV